ncbi:MAG: hypothetical protein SGI89_08660 [bacterium]|nr:hypothetical protein [bacterium]
MKKIIFIFCFILISTSAFSQIRMYENFDYPSGDSIGAHGWKWNTGVTNTIFVTSGAALTYSDYPLSGIGNGTRLRNNGNDAYKQFPTDSTGFLYASFMVKVDSIKTGGDYFVALISPTSTSNYVARFFARDTAGGLSFGLSKTTVGSGGITYTPGIYSLGTTYTVVIKYTFNPGTADDVMSAFVFSSGIPATEPGTATIGPVVGTALDAPIGRFAVRQGSATTAPTLNIDGIRLSDNWFGTHLRIKFAIQGLADVGTTRTDTMQFLLRNTTAPYAVVDSRTIGTEFTSGVSLNAFEYFNVSSGSYFLMGIYRNMPEFRNGINTWSSNGVALINADSYDFTTAANKAFGDNQILAGGVFSMYNGDAALDGTIDVSDIVLVYNDASNFLGGYLNTDITGDDFVDVTDLLIAYNNSTNFVSEVAP